MSALRDKADIVKWNDWSTSTESQHPRMHPNIGICFHTVVKQSEIEVDR